MQKFITAKHQCTSCRLSAVCNYIDVKLAAFWSAIQIIQLISKICEIFDTVDTRTCKSLTQQFKQVFKKSKDLRK